MVSPTVVRGPSTPPPPPPPPLGAFSCHGQVDVGKYKDNQDRGVVAHPFAASGPGKQALFIVCDGHGEYGHKVREPSFCATCRHRLRQRVAVVRRRRARRADARGEGASFWFLFSFLFRARRRKNNASCPGVVVAAPPPRRRPQVSDYVVKLLVDTLQNHESLRDDPGKALSESYTHVDTALEKTRIDSYTSGTTCVTVLARKGPDGTKLHIANCGDSRAIIGKVVRESFLIFTAAVRGAAAAVVVVVGVVVVPPPPAVRNGASSSSDPPPPMVCVSNRVVSRVCSRAHLGSLSSRRRCARRPARASRSSSSRST